MFDAPGAAGFSTVPVSINAEGTITGVYTDAQSTTHGFVRFANGHFDEFDAFGPCPPTATCSTVPTGINFFGLVTGSLRFNDGFLRFPDGSFVRVTVPGALDARPTGSNAFGTVTGYADFTSTTVRGFVRAPDGSVTSFDAPGANPTTIPVGINLFGSITGHVSDPGGQWHGFIRDANGNITAFDPPGSISTSPSSISLAGTVVGTYAITTNYNGRLPSYNGFLRQADGSITELAVPGFDSVNSATISPTGTVAGSANSGTQTHGYIRAPDGAFTVFDPPDSQATFVSDINAFGVVTGGYFDANSRSHAYVRVPARRWPSTAGK